MNVTDTESLPVPGPVRALAAELAAGGHDAWIVGETLHTLLRDERPRSWSLATSASAAQIAAQLPTAVPVRASGRAFIVPSPAGTIDLAPHANGETAEADLARRDFRPLAMAWSPLDGHLLDPYDGRADLRDGRLRAVGDVDHCLALDPLRALRAARLVAVHGYRVDPALERGLAALPPDALRNLGSSELRRELLWLLLGERAGAGLKLLRRTQLEAVLARGVRPDAADLVDRLPYTLSLRLAGWLRGAGGAHVLRRLRIGQPVSRRALMLLQHHPIEQSVSVQRRGSLGRLVQRLPSDVLAGLFELRRHELDLAEPDDPSVVSAREALRALQNAVKILAEEADPKSRPPPLTLDGVAVMKELGIEPGPAVGRALRYLRGRIAEEPSCNTPDRLRALLHEWAHAPPAAAP